jgi:hypothetical protein
VAEEVGFEGRECPRFGCEPGPGVVMMELSSDSESSGEKSK